MNAYDTLSRQIGEHAAYMHASTLHRRRHNPMLTQAIALQSDMRNAARIGNTDMASAMQSVLDSLDLLPAERRILLQNYA